MTYMWPCPLCGGTCQIIESKPGITSIGFSCIKYSRQFRIGNGLTRQMEASERYRYYNLLFEHCLKNPTRSYLYDTGLSEEALINMSEFINLKALLKQYPDQFIDRIDRILQNLSILYPNPGEQITIDYRLGRAFFAEEDGQGWCSGLATTIAEMGYIIPLTGSYCLSAKAWQRIDELRKINTSTQAFIAIAFREETKSIREALHAGIEAAGYTAIAIDEKEHNNQIVPEIFHEIDKSHFLVMDVSIPNYGAYYEAGYALGQKKQVIITCKKEAFEKGERPHFDIAQKSMIIWESEKELIDRLKKRIEATV